ncbi:hypothetical protein TrCOL_g9168 [Triparma columacea]|uniref:Uncharacterized protein n=1 Tax=Triparma columacea TaxID=722753 RepID=A0A9W7G1I8_9STRA|nr:hypothetical protein TrCOL_g9168 [Triparma columacea]
MSTSTSVPPSSPPLQPPSKVSSLPPPLLLLNVDPPLKQYILHLHALATHPPPKSSKQWTSFVEVRRALLSDYLSHNPEVWKRLDVDLCTQYASTNQGYDAVISGSYMPNLLTETVFDFVVDEVTMSDEHVGVEPGVEESLRAMIKEWGESNVWNKEEEEEIKLQKEGKKRGRKPGRKKKDVWDSDAESDY